MLKNNKKTSELFEFDEHSLVHLDIKTKGWKTLSKMLDKRGVKWTNEKDPNATHIVCTRHSCDILHHSIFEKVLNPLWETNADEKDIERFSEVKPKHCHVLHNSCRLRYNHPIKLNFEYAMSISSNGINKFILINEWDIYKNYRIYSYNNFKNILENEDRTEIDHDDKNKITDLLKIGDLNNVKLALTLIEKYPLQQEWILWLQLNSRYKEVKKYLRMNNIKYTTTTYSLKYRINYLKTLLRSHVGNLGVEESNPDDLIYEILKV